MTHRSALSARFGLTLGALAVAAVFGGSAPTVEAAARAAGVITGPAQQSAQRCERQTAMWAGTATVSSAGGISDTGMLIEAPGLGETLRIVGVSADGIDTAGFAHQVDVAVGATPATPGATVTGGQVSIAYGAMPAVIVNGITLVIDRCVVVAAAAKPGIGGSQSGAAALPRTGGTWVWLLVAATGLIVAGMLAGSSRRRSSRPR